MANHNQPLISVIIPVYKVENILNQCIQSVQCQDYQNIEIILVDDGSPDKSGKICDELAQQDNRIIVYHKVNGGVSSARNKGLELATGEWVTFVDSDDVLSADFFSTFEKHLMGGDFDLFMGDVEQISLNNDSFIEYNFKSGIYTVKEAISDQKMLRSGDLHGKMFKLKFIKEGNLLFDSRIHYSEDGLFFDTYLLMCYHIVLVSEVCYRYVRNEGGLSFKLGDYESEWYCYNRLITCLESLSNKTSIGLEHLLHDSPMRRCLQASIEERKWAIFSYFIKNMNERDFFYLRRVVIRMPFGSMIANMLSNKQVIIPYLLLKTYYCLKSWQQKNKK